MGIQSADSTAARDRRARALYEAISDAFDDTPLTARLKFAAGHFVGLLESLNQRSTKQARQPA